MATFLHTRQFLSYHRDRFEDLSVLVENDRNELVAVMPAARDPASLTTATSHPGTTYGGIVHCGLTGRPMLAALHACCAHFAQRGCTLLRYKVVPSIYRRSPCEDDLHALFMLGANRYRCDLSASVDLAQLPALGSQRRRGLRKACAAGVEVNLDARAQLADFWEVLAANLYQRHGASPVHCVEEMDELMRRFPDNIRLAVATAGIAEPILAGTVLFLTSRVAHVQYVAATPEGRQAGATDLLFDQCIAQARAAAFQHFDFGISTEAGGRTLNYGLHEYKMGFGATGVIHDFYELEIA
ncbi:MAG: GNAT family N-acetyltransferase [Burkholderiaceae bacterium]|nr:GNAT family N-acetyltransferase [Burkholderiaceae bacterium]